MLRGFNHGVLLAVQSLASPFATNETGNRQSARMIPRGKLYSLASLRRVHPAKSKSSRDYPTQVSSFPLQSNGQSPFL
eukprot:scaffold30497_cov171-Skeletonema_menzelii.AAC.1